MKRIHKREPRLKVFQERFELLRKERDLSNTDFAKFLEMSRQTVGFYLNGDRIPDALTLIKISEKCNVSADWIVGLSDIKTPNTSVQGACQCTGLSEEAVMVLHNNYEAGLLGAPAVSMISELIVYMHFGHISRDLIRASMVSEDISVPHNTRSSLTDDGRIVLSPKDTISYLRTQVKDTFNRDTDKAIDKIFTEFFKKLQEGEQDNV